MTTQDILKEFDEKFGEQSIFSETLKSSERYALRAFINNTISSPRQAVLEEVLKFLPEESEGLEYISPDVKEFARQLRDILHSLE